jgi:predicted nucleotidyltransferase
VLKWGGMTEQPQNNPILKRFRDALNEMYGDRLERVVLYGSRARGDAHKESDYDVAVFLRDMPDRFAEMNRLADLSTKIIVEEDGPFIHAMAYPAGSYNDPRMPLMYAIRAEGIDL